MLKYVDTMVTFSEVPDEISLCINISNCPCSCNKCHSSYLAEDTGEILYVSTLSQLVNKNKGITCICFMGGDSDPFEVNLLAKAIKENTNLLTCWYSGRQELAKEIDLQYWNFIKLGPYIEELGPLNSKTTNQKFYSVEMSREIDESGNPVYGLMDKTYKFWKK